ncbi:DUF1566 domain-containing protein [Paraglaciecola marina]|uniref:Lcl C-terminal domain-containing protein n=1 Tax=Paraglaciecola marina TaxID=2500157 RepID=UPI0014150CD3|nr:DUF1566 domain-containing protein [Paraglaciecola marina]
MRLNRIKLTMVLYVLSINVALGTCPENLELTTPDASFIDNDDGTVTDLGTGLIWTTCSLGQVWETGQCIGDATSFIWSDALEQAATFVYAESSDWRLPNIKELESLVEFGCHSPSINEGVFPNTSSTYYWSSTTNVFYNGINNGSNRAWVVDFETGLNSREVEKNSGEATNHPLIRLVRNIN